MNDSTLGAAQPLACASRAATGHGRRDALLWWAVVALLACLPLFVRGEFVLFIASQIGIYFLVALGLNFLAGYGGQLSLGHGALMAIGSYAVAIATVDHHLSFWLALPVALVVTALAGAIMALPAFRLTTWYFALVSLGFANVMGNVLIEWRGLTHGFQGIVGVTPPAAFGHVFGAADMYWLVLVACVGCFMIIRNLIDSRFGRALRGLRDSSVAVVGVGASPVRLKMTAFVISAVLAGLAGAFWAVQKTVVTPDDFVADLSIFFLLVIVLGGMGRLYGPLIGTVVFFIVPELLSVLQSWRLMIYGVALLLLMLFAPGGLAGAFESLGKRWLVRRRAAPSFDRVEAPALAPIVGASLSVRGVVKRFGGVVAVSDVSLDLAPGAVHALVGPNGSGKTTLLNLVSGYYPFDEGSIAIGEVAVARLDAGKVARLGVRRTFQTPKLVAELSVIDNVMLGAFADERSSLASIGLGLPGARREARERRAEALRYLQFVGLQALAGEEAGNVPHGQQRLVEIARAMVGRPRLLLLDEPAAGLSMSELEGLTTLVRAIAALGTTVLIVEHHLELVASLCQGVTVLAEGRILAEGSPSQVFANPAVVAAYMGVRALDAQPVVEAQGA